MTSSNDTIKFIVEGARKIYENWTGVVNDGSNQTCEDDFKLFGSEDGFDNLKGIHAFIAFANNIICI